MPARHLFHESMETAQQRLQEQALANIRRRLLIGQCTCQVFQDPPTVPPFNERMVIARYPFNPALHPWTQMRISFELSESNSGDLVFLLSYTVDNGSTWNTITIDDTGDNVCGADYRGDFLVDLSGLTTATWLGVSMTGIGAVGTPESRSICRSHVYLERPGF